MKVYKLFRLIKGKLYPLYVNCNEEIVIGEWLEAKSGELYDENHVKCRKFQKISLRPGWHSTTIPFTDWIGVKQKDGSLARRKNEVWCECEIRRKELNITEKNGLRSVPNGYYKYKTNSKQKEPWFISKELKVNKILNNDEVASICISMGIIPQKLAG